MRHIIAPQEQKSVRVREAPVQRAAAWYRGFQRFLLATPSLAPFAELLGGQSMMQMNDGEILKRHSQAMGFFHRRRDPALYNALCQALCAVTPFPAPSQEPSAVLDQFRETGCAALPAFPLDKVEILKAYFDSLDLVAPEDFRLPDHKTTPKPAEELRKTSNLAHVPRSKMLRTPAILEMATDPELISLVHRYLGAPPFLTDISAWRSFAGEDGAKPAKDAQLFHVDLDNYRFCKVFLYLSDVDEEAGPHAFVETTHRHDVISARRTALPEDRRPFFDKWYYESLRKTEEEVADWIGLAPSLQTGPAGSRFIADTSALHRGVPPQSKDRWVLQLVYGITPATSWFSANAPSYYRNWEGEPDRITDAAAKQVLHILAPN